MASNPPGNCCYKGSPHEGEVKGEFKDLNGVDTYFSYPPDKGDFTKVILFLTDILGHRFKNSQLIADDLAASGYLVIMPDIYNGDPVLRPGEEPTEGLGMRLRPVGFDMFAWLPKHTPEITQPFIDTVYQAIKRDFAPMKLGVAAYCLGAKYAIRLLDGKADAAFIAHPSFVTMDELSNINGPLSIAAAEIDEIFTTELRRMTEDKLSEMKAIYQINLFSSVEHGFAVRGDMNDAVQKFAKEQALHQMVSWFDRFLKD